MSKIRFIIPLTALLFAVSALTAAARKIQPAAEDTIKINRLIRLSKQYQDKAPEMAIRFAHEGLLLAQRTHFTAGEGHLLMQLGALNENYGHVEQGIRFQKEALGIFGQLHEENQVASVALKLGVLEGKRRRFKDASAYLNQGLDHYTRLKDQAGIVAAYRALGDLNELEGNISPAIDFYLKAQKIQGAGPVSEVYFGILKSLGKLYSKNGDHQKALSYFQEGISKSDQQRFAKTHIHFLRKAGTLHDSLGHKEEALSYHKQALNKARQYQLPEEEAKVLISIAKSIKDQDAGQSIGHLNKALGIARGIGNKQLAAEIYRSLSDIYRQQVRFKDALYALEEHHHLLDSLLNVNKQHQIAIMKGNYELEASRVRIQGLEIKNQRQIYERNAGIFAMISVVLILLTVWYYLQKTKKLNRDLAESNQVKDRLFSIIGHDLRNPIGGITQMLALLEEESLESDQQEMVTAMRKQGEVASEILLSLLNWGKAQLEGIAINRTVFNTQPVISKNIALLTRQAEDKQVVLKDMTGAAIQVWGDADHFDFIIRNLLSNAIKFSYTGGSIEIAARADAGQTVFSVTDHGQGISEDQQKKFYETSISVAYGTAGEKGTGIGLMLTKQFIKANGGRIWLESAPGQGTTFYFSFGSKASR